MKRRRDLFLFLYTGCLMAAQPLASQRTTFNAVIPPDENPWAIVTSITQDNQGYMWFSGNGIHRYDGLKMVTYRNDPLNPNTLGDNSVESLFADNDNQLWIGTQSAGFDCFDILKKTFTHYRHQPGNDNSVTTGMVTSFAQDHEGNIWVGTHGGLDRFDPKTKKFAHYKYNAADTTSLYGNIVRTVYVDRQGVVWVGTGSPFHDDEALNGKENGLSRYNKKTNTFTRFLHRDDDPTSLADSHVRSIYEDSHGNFWVGTAGDGLQTFDRLTGRFTRYPYDPVKLSRPQLGQRLVWVDDHITFIKEDGAGKLWIGTMQGGLTQYDPATKSMIRYGAGNDTSKVFPDKSGWAAYLSRDGIFWISTWEAGLYYVKPNETTFPYYRIGSHIDGMYEEKNGECWVCTHGGIVKLDARKNMVKRYPINLTPRAANYENIHDFLRDRSGIFWIATEDGLVNFNPATEKTEIYTHSDGNKNTLSGSVVNSLFEDHKGDLWVGTFMTGLNKLDRKTGKFIHFSDSAANGEGANKNTTITIAEEKNHQLWFGTYDGVNKLNEATGENKYYLKGLTISGLYVSSDNTLWVGAPEGLYKYNAARDSFSLVRDPSSGTTFKNVNAIFEDELKRLCINTSAGLYRFDRKFDNSNAFEIGYGLKNIVRAGPVQASRGRKIFFSNALGFYEVSPGEVSGNFTPASIACTDFRLGEQSMVTTNNSILPDGLSPGKTIYLSYKQNVFSFDFDVLHFNNPASNQCIYKLENYDDKWRPTGTVRSAYYFNVPPGHYTFRVKGSNSNGIWVEKAIAIVISPPWWRTWWAYTIFAIAFLLAIWGIITYRSRQLLGENRRLEEKVTQRTDQLKRSLEDLKSTQAQLIQSEKMASLGQLTAGIAHEIQNPLNFVNNFSEVNGELLEEMKRETEKGKRELGGEMEKGKREKESELLQDVYNNNEKINFHGKRAEAIVKNMLEHSRQGTGEKQATDINALADEYLKIAYNSIWAKDKEPVAAGFNVKVKTEFDRSVGKIDVVAQDIGRVLLNLYNNAFYAMREKVVNGAKQSAPGGYEPVITVATKREGNSVIITVRDNGNGIPPQIVDKIFQPFFTTKPAGQGTGLGLSLAYDIVRAHGGEIRVQSNEGEGTEFIVEIPAIRN